MWYARSMTVRAIQTLYYCVAGCFAFGRGMRSTECPSHHCCFTLSSKMTVYVHKHVHYFYSIVGFIYVIVLIRVLHCQLLPFTDQSVRTRYAPAVILVAIDNNLVLCNVESCISF